MIKRIVAGVHFNRTAPGQRVKTLLTKDGAAYAGVVSAKRLGENGGADI